MAGMEGRRLRPYSPRSAAALDTRLSSHGQPDQSEPSKRGDDSDQNPPGPSAHHISSGRSLMTPGGLTLSPNTVRCPQAYDDRRRRRYGSGDKSSWSGGVV